MHAGCLSSSPHCTRGAETPKSNQDSSSAVGHSDQSLAVVTSANVSPAMPSPHCIVSACRVRLGPLGSPSWREWDLPGEVLAFSLLVSAALHQAQSALLQDETPSCSRSTRNAIKTTKHSDTYFNSANTGNSPNSIFHHKAIRLHMHILESSYFICSSLNVFPSECFFFLKNTEHIYN